MDRKGHRATGESQSGTANAVESGTWSRRIRRYGHPEREVPSCGGRAKASCARFQGRLPARTCQIHGDGRLQHGWH
eukprot:s659_g8.t1